MNHKRTKPTSRHRGVQVENKSYRQAVQRGLAGATPAQPRCASWAIPAGLRSSTLPVADDLPSNGRRAKKRKPRAKERCPVHGVHEWYVEDEVETRRTRLGGWTDWRGRWQPPFEVVTVTTHRVATCIHCWTVKVRRSDVERTSREVEERPPAKQRVKPRAAVYPRRSANATTEDAL